jgi:hypothetical protein
LVQASKSLRLIGGRYGPPVRSMAVRTGPALNDADPVRIVLVERKQTLLGSEAYLFWPHDMHLPISSHASPKVLRRALVVLKEVCSAREHTSLRTHSLIDAYPWAYCGSKTSKS